MALPAYGENPSIDDTDAHKIATERSDRYEQFLKEFVACFNQKKLHGWDYPALHAVRKRVIADLGIQDDY